MRKGKSISMGTCFITAPTANRKSIATALKSTEKPTIIIFSTHIGLGSHLVDSEVCHGAPLGADAVKKLRDTFGWKNDMFDIPQDIYETWSLYGKNGQKLFNAWKKRLEINPKKDEFKIVTQTDFTADISEILNDNELQIFEHGTTGSTRALYGKILEVLNQKIRRMIVGSADLAKSNCTINKNSKVITPKDY